MERFEELTDQLVRHLSDIPATKDDHVTSYEVEQGTSITFDLKRTADVDVIDSFLSEDTLFPLHAHKVSKEILILYKGAITVLCDDEGVEPIRHELRKGVPFFIPETTKHLLHATEDSWVLAILIPQETELK